MTEEASFEATADLADVLDRVERGEQVVVTRLGKPVAKISALPARRNQAAIEAAAARIRANAETASLGALSILDLIKEGRKY